MALKIDSSEQSLFSSTTYRVPTPDGTLFLNIIEDSSGKMIGIDVNIGKAGSALRVWTHALSRITTMAIEKGATLEDLLTELSSQHSDRSIRIAKGIDIRSGIDGVYNALMQYRADKFAELSKQLGVTAEKMERRSRIRSR